MNEFYKKSTASVLTRFCFLLILAIFFLIVVSQLLAVIDLRIANRDGYRVLFQFFHFQSPVHALYPSRLLPLLERLPAWLILKAAGTEVSLYPLSLSITGLQVVIQLLALGIALRLLWQNSLQRLWYLPVFYYCFLVQYAFAYTGSSVESTAALLLPVSLYTWIAARDEPLCFRKQSFVFFSLLFLSFGHELMLPGFLVLCFGWLYFVRQSRQKPTRFLYAVVAVPLLNLLLRLGYGAFDRGGNKIELFVDSGYALDLLNSRTAVFFLVLLYFGLPFFLREQFLKNSRKLVHAVLLVPLFIAAVFSFFLDGTSLFSDVWASKQFLTPMIALLLVLLFFMLRNKSVPVPDNKWVILLLLLHTLVIDGKRNLHWHKAMTMVDSFQQEFKGCSVFDEMAFYEKFIRPYGISEDWINPVVGDVLRTYQMNTVVLIRKEPAVQNCDLSASVLKVDLSQPYLNRDFKNGKYRLHQEVSQKIYLHRYNESTGTVQVTNFEQP